METCHYSYYTDAKLRYSQIYLDLLKAIDVRGGDYVEKAHMESFLFHLFGAFDILLQELNLLYSTGIREDLVSLKKLKIELDKKGIEDTILHKMVAHEGADFNWYYQLKDLRNEISHRKNIHRSYYLGGIHHHEVHLKSLINDFAKTDYLKVFSDWHVKMKNLVDDCRACIH